MSKEHQTIESFDYQWREFPEGKWLLSDKAWRENVDEYILDELQMTKDDIEGKFVVDAGCGNGRWSYGFIKLGAFVYGIDASPSAIQHAKKNIDDPLAEFFVGNLLRQKDLTVLYEDHSIPLAGIFDVVWCWGVLHHLANPKKAIRNLVKLLKPNGLFHAYIYTDKGSVIRMWRSIYQQLTFEQRGKLARMQADMKAFLQGMPLTEEQKKWLYDNVPWAPSAHSNIDQYSPAIADEYDEVTVRRWFEDAGLTFIRHTPKWAKNSKNIFANGVKKQ